MYIELNIGSTPTFVIGDIHGCADETSTLLENLASKTTAKEANYIFLGDYINRGANSRQVIQTLLDFSKLHQNCHFLRGNHEDMLLGHLGFPCCYTNSFLKNGGQKTLTSYGFTDRHSADDIKLNMPKGHLDFFTNLQNYIITEKYIFVHAGLAPLIDMYQQQATDIFWIRDEFINNPHRFEKTIIFGHTPFKEIFLNLPYKIGLDTGLAFGNMLSCIELQSGCAYQVRSKSKELLEKIAFSSS